MKQETATRIEEEIINQIGDTIEGSLTVDVGTREDGWYKFDVVIFSGTDKKKDTKKMVKALLQLAEDANMDVHSFNRHEVLFFNGDLKRLFPKSGFLDKADRERIREAMSSLADAENALADVYNNAKIDRLVNKIWNIRSNMDDL